MKKPSVDQAWQGNVVHCIQVIYFLFYLFIDEKALVQGKQDIGHVVPYKHYPPVAGKGIGYL